MQDFQTGKDPRQGAAMSLLKAGEGTQLHMFSVALPQQQHAEAWQLQAASEGEQRQWLAAIQVCFAS